MKSIRLFLMVVLAAIFMPASAQFTNNSGSSSSRSSASGIKIVKDCDNYGRFNFGYLGTNFRSYYNGTKASNNEDGLKGFTLGYTHGLSLSSKLPLFLEIGGQLNFGTRSLDADGSFGYGDFDLDDYLDDFDFDDYLDDFDFDDFDLDDFYSDDDESKTTIRHNYLYLSIPVSLSYKLSLSNGLYIAPYAGLHFDLGLLYNVKSTYEVGSKSESKSISQYSRKDVGKDNTYNRFQMGYQVGVNLGYKKLNFGVGYKSSFLPLWKYKKSKLQTGGPIVTIGYNF